MRRLFRRSRQPDPADDPAASPAAQSHTGGQHLAISGTPPAAATAPPGQSIPRRPVGAGLPSTAPRVAAAPAATQRPVAGGPTSSPAAGQRPLVGAGQGAAAAAPQVIVLPYRPTSISPEELCKACTEGVVALVQLLLDAGVPVGCRDARGWTPLHLAVQQGHEAIVRLLLARGAPVSAPGPGNLHPFHVAISVRDVALTRLLAAHGANIEAAPTGATPFHLAIAGGSLPLLDALVELGANPRALITAETGKGETALHMAVAAWKDELLPRLLSMGLDPNVAGTKPPGQTALHIAAWYGYESAARTLLNAGAHVNARYADGKTALHKAAEYDQLAMCELLLEHGADIMAATPKGDTALVVAAMYGKKRVAGFLLDKTQHLLAEEQKMRVLIAAAGTGRYDVTELLWEKGFDVNATDRSGFTALDVAAMYSHESVIRFLMEKGANPGPFGAHGRHSADLAGEKDHDRIVGLLRGTIPLSSRIVDPGKEDLIDTTSLAWALSLSTTMTTKRRMMANPTPGGFPAQCNVCQDLDFRRGVPKDAEVIHWVFNGNVADAANRGCPGCQMIKQCLQHLASVYGESLAAWRAANKPCQLLSTVHGGPLYVTCSEGMLSVNPTVRAEIYSQPGFPVPWPSIGLARDVPAGPWSDQRRAFVRSLLDDCIAKHASCGPYKDGVLPTRVIDVGSDTVEPRLRITNREIGRYITLSHCWGGSSPITTTIGTLETRTMGLPMNTLPKTFRDAILITRDLGVRYLWIDSLCILQDSAEDWEREALNMAAIYEAGYVMLAAEDSENCHGGCFPPGVAAGGQTFSIGVKGPGGRNSKVHFRLNNLLSDDRGEVCHRLYSPQNGFRPSPLDKRGWTLQERILAPRTLHFGRAEIGWECTTTRACECQCVQTQTDTDSRFKAQLVNFGWQPSTPSPISSPASQKRWLWSNIVQEFTHRSLTKSSDLLPALSGLAKRMSSTAADDYVCGMWRDKLEAFLFWKPDYTFIRNQALVNMPRRHGGPQPYAPSWSWASVISPVKYEGLGEESILGSVWTKPYPINKGESTWKPGEGSGLLQVIDLQVSRGSSHTNPFGPVNSATLTIQGIIAVATFHGKQKDLPLQSSANGGSLVNTGNASAQADFEPDVRDEVAEVALGDKVYLMFLSESATAEEGMRTLPNGKLEGLSRIAFGSGLVLKPVEGRESSTYTRVGTFRFQGAAKWEAWRALRIERTVLLV